MKMKKRTDLQPSFFIEKNFVIFFKKVLTNEFSRGIIKKLSDERMTQRTDK